MTTVDPSMRSPVAGGGPLDACGEPMPKGYVDDPAYACNPAAFDVGTCPQELVPSSLFRLQPGDATAVDSKDVRQGSLGDCHLLATLDALTTTRAGRAFIVDSISEKHEGGQVSYTVTFHKPQGFLSGGKTVEVPITVTPPFDRNSAIPRIGVGDQEIWPQVIEKAYAQYAGTDAVLKTGQPPSDFMAAFTGQPVKTNVFTGLAGVFNGYSGDDLRRDVNAGKPVVLVTPPGDNQPYNLVAGHAYAVAGTKTVDGRDYVELTNPWQHCSTVVPLDEMRKLFASATVGSAPPPP